MSHETRKLLTEVLAAQQAKDPGPPLPHWPEAVSRSYLDWLETYQALRRSIELQVLFVATRVG
jgi:hypothetical protein